MRGMSPKPGPYMQTLAREWPDEHITQQLVAQLPWGHNCLLLDKLSDRSTHEWYIQKTIENGWSRSVLELQIETQVHLRVGPPRRTLTVPCRRHSPTWHATSSKTHNTFDFLGITDAANERTIEQGLVARLRDFLLELGVGFCLSRQPVPPRS